MLPNLLVIGAQKAGTTSLHRYLGAHPDVRMSERKELDFFAGPGWNWDRGVSWYESWFNGPERVHGESSPSYTVHPYVDGVPERIHGLVPDVRLIYVVRDPIERILSDYVHRRGRGLERRSLDEIVAAPDFHGSGYVARSSYATQLERYLRHFPLSRILVVAHEDLLHERHLTLARILRFLEVDDSFTSPQWSELHNPPTDYPVSRAVHRVLPRRLARRVMESPLRRLERGRAWSGQRPELPDHARARIADIVSKDAARLRRLTGKRFPSWPV